MEATTHNATRVLLGTCKCGTTHRRVLNVRWTRRDGRAFDFRAETLLGEPVSPGAVTRRDNGDVWLRVQCACSAWPLLASVRVKITDHECGAACRTAKGHVCDCSCGGMNHGADA